MPETLHATEVVGNKAVVLVTRFATEIVIFKGGKMKTFIVILLAVLFTLGILHSLQ